MSRRRAEGAVGDEAGFASYLVARWPRLVRSLVLLGCTAEEAGDLARQALVRCHPDFERVCREADPDVFVYQRLLELWGHHARVRGPDPAGHAAAVPAPTIDPDRTALLSALRQVLDGLATEQRLVVVLRFAAELDEQQVAEVLGLSLAEVASRQAEGVARLEPDTLVRDYL